MQLFKGKIRPGADLRTEIVRKDLTAAEVMVLREIHGNDAVVDLELLTNDRRNLDAEYERIVRKYSRHADGRKAIQDLFGSPQNPQLPSTLKGFKEDRSKKVAEKIQGSKTPAPKTPAPQTDTGSGDSGTGDTGGDSGGE